MGNHFSGPDFRASGDARLNIGDLYVFRTPGDLSRTALALTVSPLAPAFGSGFNPDGVYRINIDTDADAVTDIAYSVVFSDGSPQTATVYRATGRVAGEGDAAGEIVLRDAPVTTGVPPSVTEAGGARFFAGLRSDPFFADFEGSKDLQFTGTDFFADKNVLAVVLEVPNEALGPGRVGLWARTALHHDGTLVPIDRAANPGLKLVFAQQPGEKDAFNELEPSDDRAKFLDSFAAVLAGAGGYDEAQAAEMMKQLLPDILRYDPGTPTAYPNGRALTDDVVDAGLALLTDGAVTSDMVAAHDDLLDEFPYLGRPH